jgi:hypothetical protein
MPTTKQDIRSRFITWHDRKWDNEPNWWTFLSDRWNTSRPVLRVLCLFKGHVPERDMCNMPEHDFCLWCMKSTPYQARRICTHPEHDALVASFGSCIYCLR